MTHSLLTRDDSRRRAGLFNPVRKPVRLYSLFQKDINGRYVRIRTTSYSYLNALRVFGIPKDGSSIREIEIECKAAR